MPGYANPQNLNRYSYVTNNPLRYTDPTGHMLDEGEGGSTIDTKKYPCAGLQGLTRDICARGRQSKDRRDKQPRPITGIHLGASANAGIAFEGYTYTQTDYLFDWYSGTLYAMQTTGNGLYVGTPNGVSGEGYVGSTHVYNIPKGATTTEVAELLGGPNLDFEAAIGFDAFVEVGASKGLSLDLKPDGGFQHTSAGQMYATESSLEIGAGLIPTELDMGVQIGNSNSVATVLFQFPWWP